MGSVIAVSGAVGGVGTSTLAYAIALQGAPSAVLIDAQSSGTPLELLIGGESAPGTRWHQIQISTSAIDSETIMSALPEWNGVRFLSASRSGTVHQPALTHLVSSLRGSVEHIVIDVPARSALLDALQPDVHIMVIPNTIYGLGAAVGSLREDTKLAVVRSQLEDFRAYEITQYVAQTSLGVLEHERSVWMALRARAALPTNSSVMRLAAQVVAKVADAA